MYETSESGTYSVTIDLGDCTTNASIDLESTGFTSDINVEKVNMIDENETLQVVVTTDAVGPQFKWFLNESLITSAVTNTYEVNQTGNYKVVINQTSGCTAESEFSFLVQNAFPNVSEIPNLISPNNDGANDTWIIPQEYVSGTNTEVTILNSSGKVELQTDNYQNNWPENQINFKSINPVYYYIIKPPNGKTRKGSITVVK